MDINKINQLIDSEMEFAKKVNPQMALGMSQIKKLLNEHQEDISHGDTTLVTPMGKIVSIVNQEIEYPSIDVYALDELGERSIIASVEYNPEDNLIATYTYKELEDDFANKTVYKNN